MAVIEISEDGVTGEVCEDEVAEGLAFFQRIIHQKLIEPQHLRLLDTSISHDTSDELRFQKSIGTPESEWTDEDHAFVEDKAPKIQRQMDSM